MPDDKRYEELRRRMVAEQLRGRDITDVRVLDAIGLIKRELFVPTDQADQAYADGPLPIGYDQTISQPYIVASMTQLLEPRPNSKVLEIGTGSGYQTAVLSHLVGHVYTVEIIPELYYRSSSLLSRLQLTNVTARLGDGSAGWPEEAPFDGILAAAAAPEVPQALFNQLGDNGRLVIPCCLPGGHQELRLYRRSGERVSYKSVYDVRFVLMRGAVTDEAT